LDLSFGNLIPLFGQKYLPGAFGDAHFLCMGFFLQFRKEDQPFFLKKKGGVCYPLLKGNTSEVLAVISDAKNWKQDLFLTGGRGTRPGKPWFKN
jgi:hypothetical protein